MIYLTYYYLRDVFTKDKLKKWITDLFGEDVKFNGSEGRRFAVIEIPVTVFEKNKDKIITKNLLSIEGKFNVIESLSLGIRDFKNEV